MTQNKKKKKRKPQDSEVTRYYLGKAAFGRKMTDDEIEKARASIALLPLDTEVTVCYFFGAKHWNSMSPEDRRALGYDFKILVKSGILSGVDCVIRSSGNRWYRTESESYPDWV